MSPRRLSVLCLVAAIALPAVAVACLWDSDTLQMERDRAPSALELISGKFLRHTPEFYRWRIDDRLRKLKYEPDNLAYYDDLAVAYEKTGQRDLALATIRDKAAKKPGVYETESNLGTFLMLGGQLEEGLKHIDAALAINPDAHFGREKYQKRLAEYMINRRADGKTVLPLSRQHDVPLDYDVTSFATFLASPLAPRSATSLEEGERQAAIRGVLGMMRFANYDSPVLLEVLGDLLSNRYRRSTSPNEKQLAARAHLKASYALKDDPEAQKAYREKAEQALHGQVQHRHGYDQLPLENLEADFQQELKQADAWFAEVRANELNWIREGKNPEEEFARQYFGDPKVDADPRESLPDSPEWLREQAQGKFALIALLVLAVFSAIAVPAKVYQTRRAKRQHPAADPAPPSTGITIR